VSCMQFWVRTVYNLLKAGSMACTTAIIELLESNNYFESLLMGTGNKQAVDNFNFCTTKDAWKWESENPLGYEDSNRY